MLDFDFGTTRRDVRSRCRPSGLSSPLFMLRPERRQPLELLQRLLDPDNCKSDFNILLISLF
jgi:hypothetical protein